MQSPPGYLRRDIRLASFQKNVSGELPHLIRISHRGSFKRPNRWWRPGGFSGNFLGCPFALQGRSSPETLFWVKALYHYNKSPLSYSMNSIETAACSEADHFPASTAVPSPFPNLHRRAINNQPIPSRPCYRNKAVHASYSGYLFHRPHLFSSLSCLTQHLVMPLQIERTTRVGPSEKSPFLHISFALSFLHLTFPSLCPSTSQQVVGEILRRSCSALRGVSLRSSRLIPRHIYSMGKNLRKF